MRVPLLTSHYHKIQNLPPEKLAEIPRVKRMGWDRQNLSALKVSLELLLANFEAQVAARTPLEIVPTCQSPPKRGMAILIDPQTKSAYVFLKPNPKRFAEEAVLVFSRELADLAIGTEKIAAGVPTEINPEQVEVGIHLLIDFLVKERGLKVDEETLAENFIRIIEHYGRELAKQRLYLSLFGSVNLPVKIIEEEIRHDISRFRLEAKQRVINKEREGNVYGWWGKIAHLALLSVLAQGIGNLRLAAECRKLFFQDENLRERLAYSSFLYLFSDFTEMIPFQNHPLETKRQMALAKKEAEMLFVIFEEIFQSHFMGVLADPGTSEDLRLPASLN